jgi:prepilin-type N-terminal cleavage/methylation domain-containing protein
VRLQRSGFTLIELLVVLAIAAGMAALVVMPMGRWFASSKARTEVAQLHGSLQLRIKTALLQSSALTLQAAPASAPQAWQPPGNWVLDAGRLEITERGYCKGGDLQFVMPDASGASNPDNAVRARLRVEPGSCDVQTQRL